MDEFDIEEAEADFQARLKHIRSQTISENSRKIYKASTVKFLRWLLENKEGLVSSHLIEFMHGAVTNKKIGEFLDDADHHRPPVLFEEFDADTFMQWMFSLKKKDGSAPGASTYSNHRAALFNLFRDYRKRMSLDLEKELSDTFKGLRRDIAIKAGNGDGSVKSGKDALNFSLYQFLGKEFLSHAKPDYYFAHCFMVLCWYLICRAGNVTSICFSHMEWKGNARGVYFAHMKNDQFMERPKEARHVYANPTMPEICPILAMGLYLLCVPQEIEDKVKLFPGGNRYDRFRRILVRLLESDSGQREFQSRGMSASDLGTHSMRKGAATYVSSGSTACPSSTAVHLRAGWALGGVQDTYLRYEAAGDMHVGRTVSGLPTDSHEYAILPPMFEGDCSDDVAEVVRTCIPNLSDNMRMIASFGIASIIHHLQFLERTLPKSHRLFSTPLFRDRSLLERLGRHVVCRLNVPSDSIRASGIPPHISIMAHMHDMNAQLQIVSSDLRQISPQLLQGLIDVLEERAIGAGTVTRDGLEAMIQSCLEKAGVSRLVQAIDNPRPVEPVSSDTDTINSAQGLQPYLWSGAFNLVPEDFEFPQGDVTLLWQLWCCGDPSRMYPPFRRLTPNDMSTRDLKKRLSDLGYLFGMIEEKVKNESAWIPNCTVQQVNEMLPLATSILDFSSTTGKNRKRRAHQTAWRTMVNNVRKKNKQQ